MNESIRQRLEAAVRTEPSVGDPYARFQRRRRVSRGLRTVSGFVLAATVMLGFVTFFPGGRGGVPDQGIFPGDIIQPEFEPYRTFAAGELGVRMYVPAAWQGEVVAGAARVGPSLSATMDEPAGIELRFGAFATGTCEAEDCRTLATWIEDPTEARTVGLRVTRSRLHIGAFPVTAYRLRFPDSPDATVVPACLGCIGYYAEVGSRRLPLLVVAPDRASLDVTLLDLVLRTVSVR